MSDISIYDLMAQVRDHPDYVFGTVFTADDIEDRIDYLKDVDDLTLPADFDWREYQHSLGKQIEWAVMYGGDWTGAVDMFLREHDPNWED